MVKNHLSRLTAPQSWGIKRKGIKFVTRPSAGPHSIAGSLPLSFVVTNLLKYARTRREVKKILQDKKIFINGCLRKELDYPVGLMDVIAVPSLKEHYRVLYNQKGKFELLNIEEPEGDLLPLKVLRKTVLKGGKIQLNVTHGMNILSEDKKYKTMDTLIFSISQKKVKEHLQFVKNSRVYILGGKKRGAVGVLSEIKGENIIVESEGGPFETAKRHAFVIGGLKTFEK